MHAVERIQRTRIIRLVIAYLRYAGSRLFLIRVGVHLREDHILRQSLRTLTQAVIRISQVIPCSRAVTSACAVLRQVVRQRDGGFLISCLHILHLGGCIEQRVLCRRDVHIDLREVLRVLEIFIYITCLYIQRLQCIQSRISLFRCRVFLDRLTVSGNSLLVLS